MREGGEALQLCLIQEHQSCLVSTLYFCRQETLFLFADDEDVRHCFSTLLDLAIRLTV